MPAGRRNAGGPMRTHLEQAPAIGCLGRYPFSSSPLAIHWFRDRAAGTPTFWCWLMWCSATRVLGESSWSRQPTSFGARGVDSADGAGKTRAPDTAGRAAHPCAAALSSEELVEGRRDGGGHPVQRRIIAADFKQSACQGGRLNEGQRCPASAAACLWWVVMAERSTVPVAASPWGPVLGGSRPRAACRLAGSAPVGYAELVEGVVEQLEVPDLEDPLAYLHGGYRSVGDLPDHG
jgi:hypothetical protein